MTKQADPLGKLMERLACPVTKGPLRIVATRKAGAHVMAGALMSDAGLVGAIEDFKPKFTNFRKPDMDGMATMDALPVWLVREAAELAPDWPVIDAYWRLIPNGETIRLDTDNVVRIKFGAHPSSGIVRINGEELDLFHPNSLVPLVVERQGPVEIHATGVRGPHSRGAQILLESVAFRTGEMRAAGYERVAVNRARPFRARPMEILQALPADAFMLDIGGGRRMLDDERYFNMEYDVFDEADLYGDAQALPFRDESIDFIHSTAVFEHLPEPQRAAAEIHRVLKPGGRAYIVTAFMQPVHSAPQHFYNASVFGLEHWFAMFEDRHMTWGGQFSTMMMALARAAVRGRAPADKILALEHAVNALDEHVTRDGLKLVASETIIEVVK